MPLNHEWQTRIKAVDREYAAVQLATSRLLEEGRRAPTILRGGVQHRDVVSASRAWKGPTCAQRLSASLTSASILVSTIRLNQFRAQRLSASLTSASALVAGRLVG